MTIKEHFLNYISAKTPIDVLSFRVTYLLSIAWCFLLTSFAFLLRLHAVIIGLFCVGMMVSVVSLLAEHKKIDRNLISVGYMVIMFWLIMPVISLIVPYAIYDMPTYFLIGIAFTFVLLHGKYLIIVLATEICIDMLCISNMCRKMQFEIDLHDLSTYYNATLYIRVMLSILMTGTICGLICAYRNKLLRREHINSIDLEKQAEQTSLAKDMFLVNVSHEIRTPLNAILGTSEMLLDMDAGENVKHTAFQIANSSRALLAITNDLLNFSKLDYSNLKVDKQAYSMRDLLDDLINMISTRFSDNRILFFTEIAQDIPQTLIGDGAIVRQIILQLLYGIAASMQEGAECLGLQKIDVGEGKITLSICVRAKGSFLYSFEQKLQAEESEEDNYIPFLLQMMRVMDGTITIEELADERVYYISIAQEYEDETPLAEPCKSGTRILLYERTDRQKCLFVKALDEMMAEYENVNSNETFLEKCTNPDYSHIILASEHYVEMKEELEKILSPQSLILVGDRLDMSSNSLVKMTLLRPISTINLDALFHERNSNALRHVGYKGNFVCPNVRIMVVDDNLINLEVASGILKRYQAEIFTAASGMECLNTLQYEDVDIIFLDYMMPEMDGIDTLKEIRDMDKPYLKTIPVVALTANVVSGAREMFLEAGFSEYISKPIEIDKMENVLKDLLPDNMIIYTKTNEDTNEA